jgi:hypothetical protein
MTQHIVHISTNITNSCEHCATSVGGEKFAEAVNHYVEQHGYKVLHVGTETIPDMNGGPWHTTVAVVGK